MGSETPAEPVFFLKPPTALACPHEGELLIPEALGELHHEIELAILLGRGGKDVTAREAAKLIEGFGVAMDLTLRALQTKAKKARAPWAVAKGFDGSGPVGAFVKTPADAEAAMAESVAGDRALRLEINGEIRQEGRTAEMLFRPEELIAHASRYFTLEPGDLFFTGTPSGVGPLFSGDKIVASIEGLPELRFTIRR